MENYLVFKPKVNGIILFCNLLFVSIIGLSQNIRPMDGETINYRQIMFEVPKVEGATNYRMHFFLCNQRAENCREIFTCSASNRAGILSDPFEFGKTYRWYYEAMAGKKILFTSREFIFYIGKSELTDTLVQKIVFTKANKKRKKGILIIDGLKLATDMSGKPLLYLNYKYDHSIRDINLTPQGTLTVVDNRLGEVKEMKLNGEMVWIGPSKHEESVGRSDKYHHEFEKLDNGNYLAAGKRKVTDFDETAGLQGVPDNTLCETIVEFDHDKNEVWRFDLLPELKRQYNIAPTREMFNPTRLGHLNGMAYDKNRQIVYASFKTFNTVLKIEKSSNQILYQYGLKRINFLDSIEKGLPFEAQHAPIFNKKGNLLIFNNGNLQTGSGICELLVGDQVDSSNEIKNRIYFKEFLKKDFYSPQMGSVQELAKNDYLICMGSVPCFFEFNGRSKKLNWMAYTYQNDRWQEGGKVWKPLFSYRIHYYSSLYPYYFVADLNSIGKKDQRVELFNCGTEPDDFYVYYNPVDGKPSQLLAKIACKPGKKVSIKLAFDMGKGNILVRSGTGKREQILPE